jgi:endonuclease-3
MADKTSKTKAKTATPAKSKASEKPVVKKQGAQKAAATKSAKKAPAAKAPTIKKTAVKNSATKAATAKKTAKKDPSGKLVSREVAAEIAEKLVERYPDADCELTFDNDYQLLTAVILSAQCTDQQVNKVTAKLYKQFPTAKHLAEADIEVIKEIVKPTGYFNAKAKNIQTCAQALVTKYGGEVPKTQEELVLLPGVGRKTANVVLGVAHNIPGWTVDTHVQRLSNRLGFTKNSDPYKIEMDLQKLFPQDSFDWTKLSITIIWHGRRCCYARKPNCAGCPVNDLCPSSEI